MNRETAVGSENRMNKTGQNWRHINTKSYFCQKVTLLVWVFCLHSFSPVQPLKSVLYPNLVVLNLHFSLLALWVWVKIRVKRCFKKTQVLKYPTEGTCGCNLLLASDGKYIFQEALKVFRHLHSNLDLSTAESCWGCTHHRQELRDVVPVDMLSGPIGLTQHIKKGVPRDHKAGGWIAEKNRILSLYVVETNQNRGADSFLHPDPVEELIQFCFRR